MARTVSTETRERIGALESASLLTKDQARSMRRVEGIWWVGVQRLAHQLGIPATELVNIDLVDCRAQLRHDRSEPVMVMASNGAEEWWVQTCPRCQTEIREKHGSPDFSVVLSTRYLHSMEYVQAMANKALDGSEFRPAWRYRQLRAQLATFEARRRAPLRALPSSPA